MVHSILVFVGAWKSTPWRHRLTRYSVIRPSPYRRITQWVKDSNAYWHSTWCSTHLCLYLCDVSPFFSPLPTLQTFTNGFRLSVQTDEGDVIEALIVHNFQDVRVTFCRCRRSQQEKHHKVLSKHIIPSPHTPPPPILAHGPPFWPADPPILTYIPPPFGPQTPRPSPHYGPYYYIGSRGYIVYQGHTKLGSSGLGRLIHLRCP